ncbi:methionine aminopeptidase [Dichomitus squalens]|uniref:Methionine aminopeptidase n=1 Tax=Dichomitus squalens TaxID=114155 RepID=A0A4Q9PVM3_9APHY|nr:methionine aminopeptidase [Dichomitus squalens]
MRSLSSLSRAASTLSRPPRPLVGHARQRRTQPLALSHFKRQITSESEQPQSAEPSEHDLRYGFYGVILPEEPFVWGTSHMTPRGVPPQITRPSYVPDPSNPDAVLEGGPSRAKRKLITDAEDLQKLRRAAKLAAETLQFAELLAQPGNPTDFIDMGVHEFILEHEAYPSPLLYKGFPKSCCTSVNNILVHGIPDDRPLQDGDIVNVDVTVYLDGFHGDTSRTFLIGDVDEKGRELVSITEAALEVGIAACGPGRPFKDIGKAIHQLLRGKDYSVSSAFTGHGIGQEFHRQPWIHHVLNDEPEIMQPGDCFTIEPAIVQGDDPSGVTYPDGWTVSTENCARAAQAEHMVLITETGAEVLTRL